MCSSDLDMLLFHARSLEMVFRLGEDVVGIESNRPGRVVIELKSGKRLVTESALMAVGRRGDVDGLNLPADGLHPDARGRLKADANFQTEVPHIYAVGDVVGMPALARWAAICAPIVPAPSTAAVRIGVLAVIASKLPGERDPAPARRRFRASSAGGSGSSWWPFRRVHRRTPWPRWSD